MDRELLTSVRGGDVDRLQARIAEGADIHARDEHGWTVLAWAAGAGHTSAVQLLLERGADVFVTSNDGRTPYQIAVAAGRRDTARLLAEIEAARDAEAAMRSSGQSALRPYCRAYTLQELRRFPEWTEAADGVAPEGDVVFLHQDLSVTGTIWPREQLIFESGSPAWRRFCVEQLQFSPPDDLDLMARTATQ